MSNDATPSRVHLNSAARVKAARYVRTHLIHRRVDTPSSWWHNPVVAEIPGIIDKTGAQMLADLMPEIKKIGFDAVTFRPALLDFYTSKKYLDRIIEAAHDAGLYAIVRLSGADFKPHLPPSLKPFYGAEESASTTVTRARVALKSGADGIDLGRIAENPQRPDAKERLKKFSLLVRLLMIEIADFGDDRILVAETRVEPEEFYRHHLEEDWLHHLLDNRLQESPYDDRAIIRAIGETLAERSQMGVPPVWKALNSRLIMEPETPNNYPGSWEDEGTTERRASIRIILASLPGAVYLPFGFTGGHAEFKGVAIRPSAPINEAEVQRSRHTQLALALRKKYELGNANLAWVSGLDWQEPGVGVLMSGPVMSVFNTSENEVFVPLENQLLLRSDSTKDWAVPATETVLRTGPPHIFTTKQRGEQNTLAPGTTAWFAPPIVKAPNY
ncbi:MAG: hypothetical protein Q4E01_00955 [Actinomycetaceae bacterium]|nr:hypothetical protein [Actinomycetaceae bacterium]